MLSNDYIVAKVTKLLPIDSSLYEDQLKMLVGGAINRLKNEGLDNIYTEETNEAFDYVICVSYMVALDLDLDLDVDRMRSQYITRVNTLRLSQIV